METLSRALRKVLERWVNSGGVLESVRVAELKEHVKTIVRGLGEAVCALPVPKAYLLAGYGNKVVPVTASGFTTSAAAAMLDPVLPFSEPDGPPSSTVAAATATGRAAAVQPEEQG